MLCPACDVILYERVSFEMYASGIGIVKICDMLSAEKVICPSVYAFQKTGSRCGNPDLNRPYHWGQTTVRRILSNQEYVGDTMDVYTDLRFQAIDNAAQILNNAL